MTFTREHISGHATTAALFTIICVQSFLLHDRLGMVLSGLCALLDVVLTVAMVGVTGHETGWTWRDDEDEEEP